MTAVSKAQSYFLDSNIWIYALADHQEPAKREVACRLVDAEGVVISTQVINEVCFNLIRKSKFSEEQVKPLIRSFYEGSYVVAFSADILVSAAELREQYRFSFWDSLIVASALATKVLRLYSEDMQDGLVVADQLEIVNPFK